MANEIEKLNTIAIGSIAKFNAKTDDNIEKLNGFEFNAPLLLKGIMGFGNGDAGRVGITNLISNSGVVGSDVSAVGSARNETAATEYGTGTAIFAFGTTFSAGSVATSNLVNSSGVVASDTSGVGEARGILAAAAYGTDKGIFAYGESGSVGITGISNLVSNSGVVASDTSGVGTSRHSLCATEYGSDTAIFALGFKGSSPY